MTTDQKVIHQRPKSGKRGLHSAPSGLSPCPRAGCAHRAPQFKTAEHTEEDQRHLGHRSTTREKQSTNSRGVSYHFTLTHLFFNFLPSELMSCEWLQRATGQGWQPLNTNPSPTGTTTPVADITNQSWSTRLPQSPPHCSRHMNISNT